MAKSNSEEGEKNDGNRCRETKRTEKEQREREKVRDRGKRENE